MIKFEKLHQFKFSDTTKLGKLKDTRDHYLYMFLLPYSDKEKGFFPIYIGETTNLKNRFTEHFSNILLGHYWIIDTDNIEDYCKHLKIILKKDSWIKIYEDYNIENGGFYDANYSLDDKDKFKLMLTKDREAVSEIRYRYLENTHIAIFKMDLSDFEEKNDSKGLSRIRKQIEGKVILDFNQFMINNFDFSEDYYRNYGSNYNSIYFRNFKKRGRVNSTILGAVSVFPDFKEEIDMKSLLNSLGIN